MKAEINLRGQVSNQEKGEIQMDGISDLVLQRLKVYLDAHEGSLPVGQLYECVLGEVEKPLIGLVLERLRGNQIKAAAILGINRNTLRKKIRKYGLVVRRRSVKKLLKEAA